MVEEKLIGELAASLREQEQLRDEAWAEVSHGRRSVEEVVAEREAAGVSHEELELERALYGPTDPATLEHLLELMTPTTSKPPEAAANDAGRRWPWAIATLVAAAAVVLFFIPPPLELPELGGDPKLAIASLPSYTLETDSGLATERGDESAGDEPAGDELRYHESNRFTWNLRAKDPVEGDVDLRVCAIPEGGSPVVLDLDEHVEVSSSGSLHVAGPVTALGLQPGRFTIVFNVGRARALDEASDRCALDELPDIRVVQLPIVLER